MFKMSNTLVLSQETIQSPNLCDQFSDQDLDRLGVWAYDNYKRDLESRSAWLRRNEAGMDLAMQLQKEKTFPWAGCANIKFPLVTIAAMQFHARAYPAIVNGRSVVQCRVLSSDEEGIAQKRADLISRHMSWQLLEQDEGWEEEQDRALLNISIVGCGFKKSRYDPGLRHNVSEFVSAKDLVINYWARSVDSARVKTQIVPMFSNDIYERVKSGAFRDVLSEDWYTTGTKVSAAVDERKDARTGMTQPSDDPNAPFICLEQHCWLDLDCDGYEEPYIVTFEEESQKILRIVCRFERPEDVEYNKQGEVVRIHATEYFTKLPFVPSPDGGIYDIGFGVLLGPLNESVNSALNQLFDAGTISNTAGGFLGRGAKLKGGVLSFQPFSWNRVDATGDDLRKSIFPLPVREPSSVMYQLLGLLIDYTNRISGATDMLVGENPGQNTPAETSRAMLEQGQKIYSAIFKRIWRSMKQEFKKLFVLNGLYLPDRSTFGDGIAIRREDYAVGMASVVPAADPTIESDGARFARATLVREAAATNPGYNVDEVERNYLRELKIDNIDQLYPGQAGMEPTEDVKITIQRMKNEHLGMQLQQEQMKFIITMQETRRLNDAKIAELSAKAAVLEAQARSEPEKQAVAAFRAAIEAMREQNQQVNNDLDRMMEQFNATREERASAGIPALEGTPSDSEVLSGPQGQAGGLKGIMG